MWQCSSQQQQQQAFRSTTNEELAVMLRRAIRRAGCNAHLSSGIVFGRATEGGGDIGGALELAAARIELLMHDVQIFEALVPCGGGDQADRHQQAAVQQGITESVGWGIAHLLDQAEWPPERRRILPSRAGYRSSISAAVGAPGQQQRATLVTLAELPLPGSMWEASISRRVARMTTVDLVALHKEFICKCAMLLPSSKLWGAAGPAQGEMERLGHTYVSFVTKAMQLVPYEVWRRRSCYDMEAMVPIEAPSEAWLEEFFRDSFYKGYVDDDIKARLRHDNVQACIECKAALVRLKAEHAELSATLSKMEEHDTAAPAAAAADVGDNDVMMLSGPEGLEPVSGARTAGVDTEGGPCSGSAGSKRQRRWGSESSKRQWRWGSESSGSGVHMLSTLVMAEWQQAGGRSWPAPVNEKRRTSPAGKSRPFQSMPLPTMGAELGMTHESDPEDGFRGEVKERSVPACLLVQGYPADGDDGDSRSCGSSVRVSEEVEGIQARLRANFEEQVAATVRCVQAVHLSWPAEQRARTALLFYPRSLGVPDFIAVMAAAGGGGGSGGCCGPEANPETEHVHRIVYR